MQLAITCTETPFPGAASPLVSVGCDKFFITDVNRTQRSQTNTGTHWVNKLNKRGDASLVRVNFTLTDCSKHLHTFTSE